MNNACRVVAQNNKPLPKRSLSRDQWRFFHESTWVCKPPVVIKETYKFFIVRKNKQKIFIWILTNLEHLHTEDNKHANLEQWWAMSNGRKCVWGGRVQVGGGASTILLSEHSSDVPCSLFTARFSRALWAFFRAPLRYTIQFLAARWL